MPDELGVRAPGSRPWMPGSDAGSLGGRGVRVPAGKRVVQGLARGDPELGEHLAQVPLDGPRAEVELGADLRIRATVAREPGDQLLLGRQLITRLVDALADLRPRGEKLVAS